MRVLFDKCYDAVKRANENKSFGFYYSEKQNPDLSIHIHDCCEILLCQSGGKNFMINDKVYDVNDGDLFVLNQYEAHKITFDADKVFSRFVMEVHPEFLYAQSSESTDLSHCFYNREEGTGNKISLTDTEMAQLQAMFSELNAEYSFGDDIIKNMIAVKVLIFVNSLFVSRMGTEKASAGSAVNKAMDYINRNYSEHITLEMIAENSYVSVNQLCRMFNRYCGTTVSKYITSRRITEAKKLLSSGKSVTETALACGFGDYANFIRVFKKHVGVPPGKYAASIKK